MEPVKWPRVYRQRSEIQENSFKRMISHGALNVNYGTKKEVGPDRHQQREREKVEEGLGVWETEVEKKGDE